jgi:S-adenosylmethionine:tRNA ribosyltransferase-isomerase
MRTDLFDFELPEDRIALHPVSPRDAARLMVVRPQGTLEDRVVRDLPQLLTPGDVLVLNDTRVIPAALDGVRRRGDLAANVSVTLIERLGQNAWRVLARPAKRLQPGDRLQFGHDGTMCLAGALDATVATAPEDGAVELSFDLAGPDLDAAIASVGAMPLPPYIAGRREPDESDRRDYQTVYAAHDGAVAAPTAGLHFTPELLASLIGAGIECRYVTLHVGAGTFLPVKAEDTAAHKMHSERGEITPETAAALNAAKKAGRRIVAVGTTSLRLLEAAARSGTIEAFDGTTDIFITPGYRFRAVDVLMTNFHLPRSTLFMLVSALCGVEEMRSAYQHAIRHGYRFYSYGDACLLFPGAAGKG